MAIITEFFKTRSDGVNLYKTYSDCERVIIQNETGFKYDEAIDVENAPYTYSETDEELPGLTAEEALALILGGDV